MAFKFNPFTGTFDLVGSGGGTTFDPDTILTAQSNSLQPSDVSNLDVLVDSLGNVLIGV